MADEIRFDGEVAIVTGGGRGLGAAYARSLAARGASVVVNDAGAVIRSIDDRTDCAEALVAEITAAGGTAVADTSDVVTAGADIVARAVDTYGRVDIVIANAGIAGGGLFADIEPAEFDRVFAVHVTGTRSVVRAAWPHLAATGRGRIVTTSSPSIFGTAGTSPYLTGKAAVFGLTRALAAEGPPAGIRVNAVLPSAYTRLTAQVPDETFRAFLEERYPPEAVATFVTWLVHRDTTINGEAFSVGGGRAARVFLGEAGGVTIPDGRPEDWLGREDELVTTAGFEVPPSMLDEVFFQVRSMGIGDPSTITTMDSGQWSQRAADRPV
jgi:NAD(P)-dependent dehydrogenase (short-subunit alcohol dehydrogenase family)